MADAQVVAVIATIGTFIVTVGPVAGIAYGRLLKRIEHLERENDDKNDELRSLERRMASDAKEHAATLTKTFLVLEKRKGVSSWRPPKNDFEELEDTKASLDRIELMKNAIDSILSDYVEDDVDRPSRTSREEITPVEPLAGAYRRKQKSFKGS